jgi:hypothetical protein
VGDTVLAGAIAGGLAGGISGAVGGVAYVAFGKPLLIWQPVADLLRAQGFLAAAPSLAGFVAEQPPYYPAISSRVAVSVRAAGAAQHLILIGHSGAGALLLSIAPPHPKIRATAG